MAFDVRCSWSRLLRRMKACIDEFQPNASQANYFEGFWKVIFTSHKAGKFFRDLEVLNLGIKSVKIFGI